MPASIKKNLRPSEVPVFNLNGTEPRPISTLVKGDGIDLNSLGEPAVTIDRDGLVVDVNSDMERLLGENIRIQNKQLRLSDADARGRLEGLMRAIKTGSLTPQVDPIVVKRDDASPVVLRILMIPTAAQTLFFGASVILTFLPVAPRSRPAPSLLSKIFGLTPAEARLASELSGGRALAVAAKTLNISWETARTQLKTVFVKTKTHRQSELVALLSRV